MRKLFLFMVMLSSLLAGCASIHVEVRGMPAPDGIKQIKVLGLDLLVDSTTAYFYEEQEGDEYLDTLAYIGREEMTEIEEKRLKAVKFICRIRNPEKNYYTLWLFHTANDRDGEIVTSSAKKLYEGDLSLKNISVDLPRTLLLEHTVWMVIRDHTGDVRYRDPTAVRYRVLVP
jgi:hypothetical protein